MTEKFAKIIFSFLIALLITWSIGFYYVIHKHFIESAGTIWLYGILNSFLITGLLSIFLFPFFYFIKKQKIVIYFSHFILNFILLLELISLFYFGITLELIDDTIFQFNNEQATLIFRSYFQFKWYYLLLPFPIVFYFFILRFSNFLKGKFFIPIFIVLGLLSFFLNFQTSKKTNDYGFLSINKTYYFLQSILTKDKTNFINLSSEDVAFYQKEINPNLKRFSYLLYHKTDTNNTLNDFFELKETPPNLIFIIVESLSATYGGPKTNEISYTPFLDSLANHSLYFENFLATSERSFAALPSILGSLPHGERGFTNQTLGFPKNETLPTWLFQNGYNGDFHYGGYARFDNMDLFMENQNFQNIYERKEYNYEGTGLKTSIDSIPFGIPDQVFLKGINEKAKQDKNREPFVDVYFTLSSHYPFIIEEHESYYQRTREIIEKAKVEKNIKDKHHKYVKELATFLYVDDGLKMYFKEREKLKEHENTIYIIVGDHSMGEVAQSSIIEKYHPIFMIYSPLLKETKNILGVNSHLDIAPSFYNLLQQKYHFSILDSVSWLGQPFDTSSAFQSKRNVLFMSNNRKIEDMLHDEYFLWKDNLYKIENHFKLTAVENEEILEKLKKLRAISQMVQRETVKLNRLVPNTAKLEKIATIKKNLFIDSQNEFVTFFHWTIDKIYKEIYVEMNFQLSEEWLPDSKEEENPILVFQIKRNDSTIVWNRLDFELNEDNWTENKILNFQIKNNVDYQFQLDDDLKIYFWNKEKSERIFQVKINSVEVKGGIE